MFDKFRKWTNKWLKENSTQADCIDDWLLGEHLDTEIKTICIKESSLKKTPYHIFYRYKVLSADSNQSKSNTNSTNTSLKTGNNNDMNINNYDAIELSHEKAELSPKNENQTESEKRESEPTLTKDIDTSTT
jgi:hypothetical protein